MTEPAEIEAVAASLDALDVLVNNAGQNCPGGRSEYEPDVFEETVAVNLFGAFRMATASREPAGGQRARRRRERREPRRRCRRSSASRSSRATARPRPASCRLTKTLAVAWAKHGIRVNAVAPGVVETAHDGADDADSSRSPRRCSRARRWAASRRPTRSRRRCCSSRARPARYITGQTLAVDGGFSIAG